MRDRLADRGSAAGYVSLIGLLVCALLPRAPQAAVDTARPPAPGFDFLYIEANVGTSSGGHVALRVDDEVFHYQHDAEGFIALARDDWPRFRLAYNDRDNRNIHVARIAASVADRERVRDRFVHLHLVQRRHLDFLSALRRDAEWLEIFDSGRFPEIAGAGFFRPHASVSPEFEPLSRRVAACFGLAHIERSVRALEARLMAWRYAPPDVAVLDVDPRRYSPYPVTFSENYQELASRLVAFRVLSGTWSLDERALLDPDSAPRSRASLSAGERMRLNELARQLEAAILSLLRSPRADSGFPLLLALARLGAVYRSLALNHWLLLDPFYGRTSEKLPLTAARRQMLPLLEVHARQTFQKARRSYFSLDELDEASLNVVENTAARYHVLRREGRLGERIRLPDEFVVPAAARAIGVSPPALRQPSSSVRRVDAAEQRYRDFRKKVRSAYGYDLITRNCATELIRSLNASFSRDSERVRALGSRLDPAAGFAFIPFRLYDEVTRRWRTADRFVLPSYRNQALAGLSKKENPLWIYLAEATTATSALYTHRSGDTRFLFFTEDMPWLRPLYGAVNLGYGLLNAIGGVFTVPFDQGERLSEGIRGALFSVPELVFFNIRKGSFEPRRLARSARLETLR